MEFKQDHQFKKKFGQNFIKSSKTISKVIDYLEVSAKDEIIEIGPGDGRFTEELLNRNPSSLKLIEIDSDLYNFLGKKFESEDKVKIENMDIMEFNEKAIKGSYKIYGSLPYNISKRIIAKFLETENSPERMVFIVQKEVADDYVAEPKDASFLSNYIKVFADVKLKKTIPRSQFHPMPQVDGGVLLIKPHHRIELEKGRAIAKFIFNGFRNKRKKLSKTLKSIYSQVDWPKTFDNLEINPNARAQELEFEIWLKLFEVLNNAKID